MVPVSDAELALRVISHIHPRGDIVGLNVPADLLDPEALRIWARVELGDDDLAASIGIDGDAVSLLAERRRQSDALLASMTR